MKATFKKKTLHKVFDFSCGAAPSTISLRNMIFFE